MFERIHQKLGTAGFIISIVALVAALGGGAYAATSNGGGKATASAKQGKQGKPGKPGKTGPAGPAGPQGSAGAPGAKGDTGAAGVNGTNGTNGTNGKSVSVATIAEGGSKCEGRAGAEVKQEGASSGTAVCNGKNGTTGFTSTLPSGKTETGAWSVSQGWTGGTNLFPSTAISFPIPLVAGGGEGSAAGFNQHETEEEEFGASGCQGTAAEPTAPPGKLCVYTYFEEGLNAVTGFAEPRALDGSFFSYGPSGATLFVGILSGNEQPSKVEASGSWAVTAP